MRLWNITKAILKTRLYAETGSDGVTRIYIENGLDRLAIA